MKLSQTSCQSARQACRPFAVANRASYAELAQRGADKVLLHLKYTESGQSNVAL